MCSMDRASYNTTNIIQQVYSLFKSVNCSTCFGWYLHPSSGAHNTESTVFGINSLTPNDHYSGRTAPLTSKRFILYIYSTNIGTEYFKHGTYTLFSLQNAVSFIILTYLVHALFTFYIQGVLKFKK